MNKKFIRVLGFGVGLFLAGSLSVNAQKVSFNGERLSLKQAFEKIESVSKYKIAYNTSQLDVNKQVVLNQKNQDVLQILSDLLKGTNCVYQVNDNYIVITLKDDEKVKKIKGTIKDSAGEPIIGANVILKGDATVGSITDIDGNFDLSVPSNATLQVSYIGYNTQDVPIGNKSFLNITLKEDTETLDEVVVVGYGSQKKVNVIGSIASVDSKALESRAVPDVSNMLTGQMSGVTITQESGNPGQDAGTGSQQYFFDEDGHEKQYFLLQFHKTVIGHPVRKQVFQMFADILFVIMLEAAETTGVEQNKNDHHLRITHPVRLITMPDLLVFNHIFFLLKRKFLAKIIGHTINLCNFRLWKHSGNRLNVIIGHYKFNDFIAMFLIVRKIYLFLYRIHVKLL